MKKEMKKKGSGNYFKDMKAAPRNTTPRPVA
jgi:hypothetical protein